MDLIKSSEFSGSRSFQACRSCCKLLALQILMPQQYSADCSRAERGPKSPHSEFNVQYNGAAGRWRDWSSGKRPDNFLFGVCSGKSNGNFQRSWDICMPRSQHRLVLWAHHTGTHTVWNVKGSKQQTQSSKYPRLIYSSDVEILNRRDLDTWLAVIWIMCKIRL